MIRDTISGETTVGRMAAPRDCTGRPSQITGVSAPGAPTRKAGVEALRAYHRRESDTLLRVARWYTYFHLGGACAVAAPQLQPLRPV